MTLYWVLAIRRDKYAVSHTALRSHKITKKKFLSADRFE